MRRTASDAILSEAFPSILTIRLSFNRQLAADHVSGGERQRMLALRPRRDRQGYEIAHAVRCRQCENWTRLLAERSVNGNGTSSRSPRSGIVPDVVFGIVP